MIDIFISMSSLSIAAYLLGYACDIFAQVIPDRMCSKLFMYTSNFLTWCAHGATGACAGFLVFAALRLLYIGAHTIIARARAQK